MSDPITVRNVHEVFLHMEEAEGLFDLRTEDGTYYWDIVRRNVMIGVHSLHGGGFAGPALVSRSLVATAKDVVRLGLNRLVRRYIAGRAPRYLFVTCQRERRGEQLFDPIADPVRDSVPDDSVAVELVNTAAVSYADMVRGRPSRVPPVAVPTTARPKGASKIAERTAAAVRKHFGVALDAHGLVAESLAIFEANRNHYLRLFAEHRPTAVVCTDNATLKGLYSAAKEMRVPTLELQHGEINKRNPGYSYPGSISSLHPGLAVPTAFLTFGEYWNGVAHFPVETVSAIGNDYFCQPLVPADEDGVLMVSAYHYHAALLALALDLADRVGQRKIYYKLHPHQFAEKEAIVQAFRHKTNIVVVSDGLNLADLLKRCDTVVGVHSTLTYIALQAGKRMCLYKRSNYYLHDDVFAYVELFDNASELQEIIAAPLGKSFGKLSPPPTFFQPFDARRFTEVVERVVRN